MPLRSGIRYYDSNPARAAFPPVILLHGAGASHLAWPPLLRRLEGLRVIAPDLPGHGDSMGPSSASIPAYAERMLEFLDGLGIYHTALAGHSMGAFIALEMVRLAPGQVTCLALLSAGLEPPSSPRIARLIDQPFDPGMVRQVLWETFFSPATSAAAREKALRGFGAVQARRLVLDWRLCQSYAPSAQGFTPGLPVCVVSGLDDLVVKPATARALAAAFPGGCFHLVTSAGHMLIQEQPEQIALLLSGFFENCYASLFSPAHTRPLASQAETGFDG